MLKYNFIINKNIFSICLTAMLLAEACSPSSNENSKRDAPVAVAEPVTTIENNQLTVPNTATAVSADEENDELAISFIASNDQGTVMVSGEGSPVAEWFANQPGEVPLDLVDADAADAVSVAEEMKRYISLAVYFAEGKQTKAEEILQAAEMGEIEQPISIPRSSLEKIKSNLVRVFDVRGFLSTTTFIVSRQ